MKAALLRQFKTPLVIEDVPRPLLEANDVLIRVEACGVCHSDLHVADGDWPQFASMTKIPLILGHEIAGKVVEKGDAVREFQIGDRVVCPGFIGLAANANFATRGTKTFVRNRRLPE